jgi:hypothetical protein
MTRRTVALLAFADIGHHAMDWDWDALSTTIDLLRSKGIQQAGSGRRSDRIRSALIV